jgi:hypothetical protein
MVAQHWRSPSSATRPFCSTEAYSPSLNVALLKLTRGDPLTQRPGRVVQRGVSAARRNGGDVVQDLAHVRLGRSGTTFA